MSRKEYIAFATGKHKTGVIAIVISAFPRASVCFAKNYFFLSRNPPPSFLNVFSAWFEHNGVALFCVCPPLRFLLLSHLQLWLLRSDCRCQLDECAVETSPERQNGSSLGCILFLCCSVSLHVRSTWLNLWENWCSKALKCLLLLLGYKMHGLRPELLAAECAARAARML